MTPQPGQVWRATHKRYAPYVRVLRPPHAGIVCVRSCDEAGNILPRTRTTYAHAERFLRFAAEGFEYVGHVAMEGKS